MTEKRRCSYCDAVDVNVDSSASEDEDETEQKKDSKSNNDSQLQDDQSDHSPSKCETSLAGLSGVIAGISCKDFAKSNTTGANAEFQKELRLSGQNIMSQEDKSNLSVN